MTTTITTNGNGDVDVTKICWDGEGMSPFVRVFTHLGGYVYQLTPTREVGAQMCRGLLPRGITLTVPKGVALEAVIRKTLR